MTKTVGSMSLLSSVGEDVKIKPEFVKLKNLYCEKLLPGNG
jgi:hypothetical protein